MKTLRCGAYIAACAALALSACAHSAPSSATTTTTDPPAYTAPVDRPNLNNTPAPQPQAIATQGAASAASASGLIATVSLDALKADNLIEAAYNTAGAAYQAAYNVKPTAPVLAQAKPLLVKARTAILAYRKAEDTGDAAAVALQGGVVQGLAAQVLRLLGVP